MAFLAVYKHTGGIAVNFVQVFESDLGREKSLVGGRNPLDQSCHLLQAAVTPNLSWGTLLIRWPSANQLYNIIYHDLIEFP